VGTSRQRPLNTKLVGGNIAEANEQLARLLRTILTGKLSEEELAVGLRHAYSHLNFAWNIRRVPTSEYANLTQEQFEEWGKYPSDIDAW
jgi:hypothetical protein